MQGYQGNCHERRSLPGPVEKGALSLPQQPLPQWDDSDSVIGLLGILGENNHLFHPVPVLSRKFPASFYLPFMNGICIRDVDRGKKVILAFYDKVDISLFLPVERRGTGPEQIDEYQVLGKFPEVFTRKDPLLTEYRYQE